MAEPDLRSPLMLRCELVVGDRVFGANQLADRRAYEEDPLYRAHVEGELHRALGEGIVSELTPPIEVIEASSLGEAMYRAALDELPDA